MKDKLLVKLTVKKPPFMDIRTEDFQYPREAFAVMEYGCEECGKVEIIWNSRDGVTPFVVDCPFCHGTMQHINWSHDRFTPNYIPPIGSRVFFSCKNIHEDIQDIFNTYTEEVWNKIKNNWEEYCTDRYELIWKIASFSITDDLKFDHPHIAVITEKNQERFMSRYAIMLKSLLLRMKETIKNCALSVADAGAAFKTIAEELKKCDIMKKENIKKLYRYEDITYHPGLDESGNPLKCPGRTEVKELEFKVVKHTPKGVWIEFYGEKKFVNLTSNRQYASATKYEALLAFIRRKQKCIEILNAKKKTTMAALEIGEKIARKDYSMIVERYIERDIETNDILSNRRTWYE